MIFASTAAYSGQVDHLLQWVERSLLIDYL